MKIKIILPLFFVFIGCKPGLYLPMQNEQQFAPPGTVRVSDSIYYDIWEITNLNWKEYVAWNKTVYGDQSDEYLASIPDTTVLDPYEPIVDLGNYYNSSFYDNRPVLGISKEQIRAYTNWRTDRVVEMILIQSKKLESGPNRFDTIPFSVNTWSKSLSNEQRKETFIPVYSLPTKKQFDVAVAYNDSVLRLVLVSNKYLKCRAENYSAITQDTMQPKNLLVIPTYSQDQCMPYEYDVIYYLKSNVDECIQPYEAVGFHSFKRAIEEFNLDPKNHPWTGFRNTCSWMTVEDYLVNMNLDF